jgi:outer membrane receptor protein involved in Fe transport
MAPRLAPIVERHRDLPEVHLGPSEHDLSRDAPDAKAGAQVALGARVRLDADFLAASAAMARGNENNGHAPDGIFYLGPGHSPGYAVANLGLTVRATSALSLFARVGNVFDRRYATAAQLGVTAFDAGGRFVGRPFPADAAGHEPLRSSTFYAPGAPRSLSLGLRYTFE